MGQQPLGFFVHSRFIFPEWSHFMDFLFSVELDHVIGFNSLAPGRCGSNLKSESPNKCHRLNSWAFFCEIIRRETPQPWCGYTYQQCIWNLTGKEGFNNDEIQTKIGTKKTGGAASTPNILLLPMAWISNHMLSKVWDEITYPYLNFNGCTAEV